MERDRQYEYDVLSRFTIGNETRGDTVDADTVFTEPAIDISKHGVMVFAVVNKDGAADVIAYTLEVTNDNPLLVASGDQVWSELDSGTVAAGVATFVEKSCVGRAARMKLRSNTPGAPAPFSLFYRLRPF